MRTRVIRWGALGLGIVLFLAALYYIDLNLAVGTIRRLGFALPLALLFSGLWHLARTWAWAWCFPQPRAVSFLRLARVRLAAEAFSYLTLRGIAGEPLKVVLLGDRVGAREATAAVALERLAYLVGTTVIVGVGSIAAIAGLELTRIWFRVFRAFAIAAAVVIILTTVVITGHGRYLESLLRRVDAWLGTSMAASAVGRFVAAVETQVLELVRGNPLRLIVLLTATVLSYLLHGARGVGDSARIGRADHAEWRVGGGDVLARRQLRVGVHPGQSRRARSIEPRGGRPRWERWAEARRSRWRAGCAACSGPASGWRFIRAACGRHREPGTTRGRAAGRRGDPALLAVRYGGVRSQRSVRLAGLPIAERVIRAALRAGYRPDHRLDQRRRAGRPGARCERLRATFQVSCWCHRIASGRSSSRSAVSPIVTAIGPGTVVSPALLADAARFDPSPERFADVPAGPQSPESGVLRLSKDDAVDRECARGHARARARARALPLPVGRGCGRVDVPGSPCGSQTRADLAAAEATIRRASYKDTDNTLARLQPPDLAADQHCADPDAADAESAVGAARRPRILFGVAVQPRSLLDGRPRRRSLSLAASILDGCDGEIARLKYQESALGCWIETFGDYSYYIAIFIGLTIGAVRQTRRSSCSTGSARWRWRERCCRSRS